MRAVLGRDSYRVSLSHWFGGSLWTRSQGNLLPYKQGWLVFIILASRQQVLAKFGVYITTVCLLEVVKPGHCSTRSLHVGLDMLSFVDTRILLLLAVTSYLASCQCKFEICFFFLTKDLKAFSFFYWICCACLVEPCWEITSRKARTTSEELRRFLLACHCKIQRIFLMDSSWSWIFSSVAIEKRKHMAQLLKTISKIV